MDGYSVTEAASVLGVPTERVWELLARGILAGSPQGETGMRVFLQPRAAPPVVEPVRPANGGSRPAGEHGREREREPEASPFRELLTEFRNLTERYGQALLALGEARGEVASLRSRVDLLEARFELRLPGPGMATAPSPAPAAWAASPALVQPAPESPPPTPAPPPARVEPERRDMVAEADADVRPRRRPRGHPAAGDIAEALARMQDPSPAELPGAAEAAAALAAYRRDAAEAEETAEAGLPRELPVAEPMASVEPEPQPVPAPVTARAPEPEPEPELQPTAALAPEPDSIATLQPEPEPRAAATLEPEPMPAPALEPEPEPMAAAIPESKPEPVAAPAPEAEPQPEPMATVVPEPEPTTLPAEPEPMATVVPEPEPTTLPAEPEPMATVEPEPDLVAGEATEVAAEPQPVEPVTAPMAADTAPYPEFHPGDALTAGEEPEPAAEAPWPEFETPPPSRADGWDRPAERADTAPSGIEHDAGEQPAWDRDRYTAAIEEPDWIPEEPEPRPGASAGEGDRSGVAGVTPEGAWAPSAWTEPAEDAAAEMEVAGSGSHAPRPPLETAAVEEEGAPVEPTSEPIQRVPPTGDAADWRSASPPAPSSPEEGDPESGTATRAYRRLRRILPG